MLEELQRRNYSQNTAETYTFILKEFTNYFHRAPDQLGPEPIRQYQVHLFRERKLSSNSVRQRVAALRFFFVKNLRRPYMVEHIPFSQGIPPPTHRAQPRGGSPSDRLRQQPSASGDADDAVCHGYAPSGTGQARGH